MFNELIIIIQTRGTRRTEKDSTLLFHFYARIFRKTRDVTQLRIVFFFFKKKRVF